MNRRLLSILSVALCFWVYSPGFSDQLVADAGSLVVQKPLDVNGLLALFGQSYWGTPENTEYRPLGVLLFALLMTWFGQSIVVIKAAMVCVHLFVVGLTWRLGKRLFDRKVADGAALIYAFHPLATEAVLSVVGVLDMLMACFALVIVNLALSQTKRRHYFMVVCMCFLCPLVKETAVVLPALLACVVGYQWLNSEVMSKKLIIWAFIGLAGYMAFRYLVFPLRLDRIVDQDLLIQNPLLGVPMLARWFTALFISVKAIGMLIYPTHLSSTYYFDQIPIVDSWTDPRLWLAVGVWLAIAWLVTIALRRRLAWPICMFACGLVIYAPTSHFVLRIYTIFGERLLYPILPFAVLGLARGLSVISPRKIQGLLLLGWVLLGGFGIWKRAPSWANDEALVNAAVISAPNSVQTKISQARHLWRLGHADAAIACVQSGVAIAPWYVAARVLAVRMIAERWDERSAEAFLLEHPREWRTSFWFESLMELRLRRGMHPETGECADYAQQDLDLANQILSRPDEGSRWLRLGFIEDQELAWVLEKCAAGYHVDVRH